MGKAERLKEYYEKHKPMCFSRENDMKPFCKSCPYYLDCHQAFWDKITSDGKAEPLPERGLDD